MVEAQRQQERLQSDLEGRLVQGSRPRNGLEVAPGNGSEIDIEALRSEVEMMGERIFELERPCRNSRTTIETLRNPRLTTHLSPIKVLGGDPGPTF